MKKGIAWLLCLALALSVSCAFAAEEEPFFQAFEGMEWSFCSGVGAWSTDLRIAADGTFSGEYHDSEMGESEETYPNGTIYCCSFTGRMTLVEQVDDFTWKIRIEELRRNEDQAEESIDDGVRFVKAEPYGLSEGDEMLLYRPGTPVSMLPEEMVFWAHVMNPENPPAELEDWFLTSMKNDSGFVGCRYPAEETVENP